MANRLYTFVGGSTGAWSILSQTTLVGRPLPIADRLEVLAGDTAIANPTWALRGITSNDRYVQRSEKAELIAKQQGLGRAEAACAALIPIRKTPAWWALSQDERREIFEAQSQHIRIGLKHLPPVARRLHHCRDLAEAEPFDFLTWFEYAPGYELGFDALLSELRASLEWQYVDWEIDIRLARNAA